MNKKTIFLFCLFFFFVIGAKDAGAATVSQNTGYFTIDGIEYYLTPSSDPDKNFAAIRSFQKGLEDLAVNGRLVFPSSVTYEGVTYTVNHIAFSDSIPETVQEIVIPESPSGTDFICYVGIFDVEKITVLSNQVRLAPYYYTSHTQQNQFHKEGSYRVPRLKEVEIKSNNIIIEKNYFYNCNNLESVAFLPDAKLRLVCASFHNCPKLTELRFPSGLDFSQGSIIGCDNLSSISFLKKSARYGIRDGCLLGKSSKNLLFVPSDVTSFTLWENVPRIGKYAFSNCKKLKKVDTSKSKVKYIERFAFYNCTALEEIKLSKTINQINDFAFSGTRLKSIAFPSKLEKIGPGILSNIPTLNKITVDSANKKFKSQNNMLLSKNGKALWAAVVTSKFSVPEGICYVYRDFITNPDTLKEITYPKSLLKIASPSSFEPLKNLKKVTLTGPKAPNTTAGQHVVYAHQVSKSINTLFYSKKTVTLNLPLSNMKNYLSFIRYSRIEDNCDINFE